MEMKDCKQAKSGDCCWCKNMAYEQLKLNNETMQKLLKQKIVDIFEYEAKLNKIKAIMQEPCLEGLNCKTCQSNCMQKDVLAIIEGGK